MVSILIVSLLVGLTGVGSLLYYQYRSFLYDNLRQDMTRNLELARLALDNSQITSPNAEYLKDFVDRMAAAAHGRLTIIDRHGTVLADSEIPAPELAGIENHLDRPEIQQSLSDTFGFQIRYSTTLERNLWYLSRAIKHDEQEVGFLRLALFAERTDQMLMTGRLGFVLGGILVMIGSSLLVVLLSRRLSRNLNELVEKARRMAGGDLDARIRVDTHDELRELGDAVNSMAKRLSKNLRKLSRERYELDAVLSSVNEGIIAISAKRKIIFLNDVARQALEHQAGELRRKYYYQVIRNKHLASLLNNFFERPLLISDEIQLENGVTLEVVIAPFDIDRRNKKGAVVILRDVTHYKKLEKIRSDFVANVSHEFKTPLAAIRGYAETLLDWAVEDPIVNRKYLQKVVKQSNQLETLVSDLLQLARIERWQTIDTRPFSPGPVLADIVAEYAATAAQQQVNLDLDPRIPPGDILGDPEMFRSIMTNLIDNAIKYTPADGRVRISGENKENECVFSVSDSGIGIPAKYLERIFERFYRVDKARSRAIGGTGLGLSIVKHLAELQDAQVWVESEPDQGSTFYVKFSLASAADSPAEPREQPSLQGAESNTAEAESS